MGAVDTPGDSRQVQRVAARTAGALYLLMMATGVFAEFFARGSVIVPGDAAATAANIAAHQWLFRAGTVADLITFAGDVALVLALCIVLKPVGRNLALLGVFWRVAECAILGIITLNDFAALRLLGGASYLHSLDRSQLQALAQFFIALQGDGYQIGLLFFGLGSTVFAILWLRSRYIPRGLAAWGIFASLLVVLFTLAVMLSPELGPVVMPACFLPVFIFEVGLGSWLLARGIRFSPHQTF